MTTKQVFAGLAVAGTLGAGGVTATDASINPYTTDGTTLEIAAASATLDAGAIATKVDTDTPRIEMDKWDGTVKLGITSLDVPVNTTGARPFLSKNVEWQASDITMQAVPLNPSADNEDGGEEINLILNSEPASNVFTFALDGADDLDFFYQPPLNETPLLGSEVSCTEMQCIDADGHPHRQEPENVVGSYAVYYKNHRDHIEGQTNYATGKAYHIYRPKVTDAKGNETWAALSYDDHGTLSVTVPQDFLDNAAYPVVVDPTIGTTILGANNFDIIARASDKASQLYGQTNTMPENGTLTSITAGIKSDIGSTADLYFALFSQDSGGVGTHAKVGDAESLATVVSATAAQYTGTAHGESLTNGTNYLVMVGGDGNDLSATDNVWVRYDSAASRSYYIYSKTGVNSYTDLKATDPLVASANAFGANVSTYATYALVAAAPKRPRMNVNSKMIINGKMIVQ